VKAKQNNGEHYTAFVLFVQARSVQAIFPHRKLMLVSVRACKPGKTPHALCMHNLLDTHKFMLVLIQF
jgi:hypothetical protein